MAFIYETENFEVTAVDTPHVSREEGGHIRIATKNGETDRTKLMPNLAIEFMRLTMIVGEAFEIAMNNRGIPVIKLNYQEMGNWAYKSNNPFLFHQHIYGRVLGAKHQPFPESVCLPARDTGFYEGFEPLNYGDIKEVQKQIEQTLKQEKYNENLWSLL